MNIIEAVNYLAEDRENRRVTRQVRKDMNLDFLSYCYLNESDILCIRHSDNAPEEFIYGVNSYEINADDWVSCESNLIQEGK